MNEAHNIEWKQSWRDEYLKWICTFANSDGGMLYIGKDDKGNSVHLEKNGGIEVTLFKAKDELNVSEEIRKKFGVISEKLTNDLKNNIDVLTNFYSSFVDFVAFENNISSEKLRRNFGDKKALLLFLITLKPEISAVEASEKIGVSDRTVETYIAQLKETILKRIGPDKGGYWKITIL